ncbi:DUF6193 family natural product biosynthesis protein [Streptomyces sp. A0592]|uniref:DUF6193 family natural product biosynthesis protein n=1 Tax=Streptomyces sp. A0592 TaxID=2563099 RepID=UPI00109E99D2|nr:DUF6193 family natural product biosynthesis protein [Streptomyces sp. A0592]THA80195.1 hypothetical protein E6U81_29855 [Streptomyces sp. A0592]
MHEQSLPTPDPSTWYPVDGLGDTVEERWLRLQERLGVWDRSSLRELVEAAFVEPRLRALSPGTSVYWLRFSHRAAPPVFGGLPLARTLRDGRYEVRTADGRLQEAANAAEAVSLLVSALPADLPAPP